MMHTPWRGVGTTPTIDFAIVLKGLEQYRELVHLLAQSPLVAVADFAYGAPIYKGSEAIKEALGHANNALEKFDVYFNHAILDEQERLRFARLFASAYVKRFPASERSDLFLASGEVLKFSVELVPPTALPDDKTAVLEAIETTPHDSRVLRALREGASIDRAHLRGELKIFLDHILNPRRHDVSRVRVAAKEIGTDLPYVVEMMTDGAMPGYLHYAVEPLVEEVGGRMVILPG